MTFKQPDFWVLEYITITKDPRADLVIAIGGTEKTADILQRTGGFLTAGHQPVDGGGDLGRDFGDLTAGLGGSDSLGEMGEVAQSRVVVAVRRGQRVQGGVEVDACAGA
jgi:hypothetical protein